MIDDSSVADQATPRKREFRNAYREWKCLLLPACVDQGATLDALVLSRAVPRHAKDVRCPWERLDVSTFRLLYDEV